MKPVRDLKNIGEKSARWLEEIGVFTEGDLRTRGVIDTYIALKANDPQKINLMMLWALQGALMNQNCLYLPQEIKDVLKEELESAAI